MNIQIIKNKDINKYISWPIWNCEISRFDWEYDSEEHCYILKGKVTITTSTESIKIQPGDYVIFPKGLKCVWDVHSAVKKHYLFK
jgi:hypothetical protein